MPTSARVPYEMFRKKRRTGKPVPYISIETFRINCRGDHWSPAGESRRFGEIVGGAYAAGRIEKTRLVLRGTHSFFAQKKNGEKNAPGDKPLDPRRGRTPPDAYWLYRFWNRVRGGFQIIGTFR